MLARPTFEECPYCRHSWSGFGPAPRRALEAHKAECPRDPFLLEAMHEVDALTPSCPPIAPPFRGRVALTQPLPEVENIFPTIEKW